MADQKESSSGNAQQRNMAGNRESGSSQQPGIARSQQGGGGVARSSPAGISYIPSPAEFFANPFAAMRRMHEDMDRIFAQALGGTGGGLMSGGETGAGSAGSLATWSPAIEVKQKGNNLTVCAELPGLKPDEVHVEVNEDALIIEGERRNEMSSDEGGVHRTERRYGRFHRAIPLPEGANTEDARAEFRDGMLEVTVPLPQQQTRRRQIPITGGADSTASAGTGATKQATGTQATPGTTQQ